MFCELQGTEVGVVQVCYPNAEKYLWDLPMASTLRKSEKTHNER